MLCLDTDLGVLGSGVARFPLKSLDGGSSGKYLTMSDSDFGAFNKAKFAVSVWIKITTAATDNKIIGQFPSSGASNLGFYIIRSGTTGKVSFVYSENGTSDKGLTTTQTITSTGVWHHIAVFFDSAQGSASDRVKIYLNGSLATLTGSLPTAQINDSTLPIGWGINESNNTNGVMNGFYYQPAFFSGSIPLINELVAGGQPQDIRLLTGLYSLLDVAAGDVTSDYVLSANWTNNGTVAAGTDTP